MYLAAAEHFVRAPDWRWYILGYFFLAGLGGGSYVIGAMLRLFGRPGHEAVARLAFLIAFPLMLVCPILLTLDLGQPTRFWHMMVDSAQFGLNFKYWSPMSLGVWALAAFTALAFISFVEALLPQARAPLGGLLGRLLLILGLLGGIFIAAYTGVLLSVSNQPVWSDGWPLGALFLASGLSGAAALLLLFARSRSTMRESLRSLDEADRYFVLMEAVLIAVFLLVVGLAGTLFKLFDTLTALLWVLVLLGLAVPFLARRPGSALASGAVGPLLVLLGVLALRAVVIFGAQG